VFLTNVLYYFVIFLCIPHVPTISHCPITHHAYISQRAHIIKIFVTKLQAYIVLPSDLFLPDSKAHVLSTTLFLITIFAASTQPGQDSHPHQYIRISSSKTATTGCFLIHPSLIFTVTLPFVIQDYTYDFSG
jgi:hypothetical protein